MTTFRLLIVLLIVPLVGCDDFMLEDLFPTVQFQRMDVQDIDFEHIEADFVFSVDNPNPVQIELSSFSYDFDLEGQSLLAGDNDEGFQLEAIGSSELVLPMSLGWQDAWSTVQATRGEDYVDFGLAGHFGFDTNTEELGEVRIPYDEDGNFPALRTPNIRFERIRVDSVSLLDQTATIHVDLGVDNAHRSTLFFDAMDYDLRLGGTHVASGYIDELGEVAGATEATLSLPVEIDLIGVGSTVINALTGGGTLQAQLDATMDVDTPFGIVPLDVDELVSSVVVQ